VKLPRRADALDSIECQRMPFGKYTGMCLYHIALIDPTYLEFVAEKAETLHLRMRAEAMCERFETQINEAKERRDWRRRGW